MAAKVEFWSDFIEAPRAIFRNLRDETIARRCRDALEAHGGEGDVWACRSVITRDKWEETRFCFIKQGGEIFADPELQNNQ